MGLRITGISARLTRVPLTEPFAISTQTMAECEHVLAVVETDAGITGIGSVSTIPAFMGETGDIICSAINYLAGPVRGHDPFDIESIVELMDAELAGISSAKAAIDFACHDIMGKSLGIPVYRLLGGRFRERIDCTWVIGIKSVSATVTEARSKFADGFGVLKIKIGHDKGDDLEKIRLIREELGRDVKIRIDANTAYTADQAIGILSRLEAYDLEMIEQPCREKDIRGMARLRAALSTPILADEAAMSLEQVFQIIDGDAADIINIKLGKAGGLHKARRIAAVAKAAHMPVVIGSNMELGPGIAAGAHLAASTAHVRYASDLFAGAQLHRYDIVEDVWRRDGMTIAAPDAPGLGVTLNNSNLSVDAA